MARAGASDSLPTIVIIPAYNESAHIAQVVADARAHTPTAILVVDDCSRDDTAARAREAGAIVLNHPFNMGYGAAVQTGIRYACERGFQALAQMDGDGQHDPACLKDILAPIAAGDADYVIGSRFLPSPDTPAYSGPCVRRLGSRLISALVRLSTGLKITDPTSGFVVMNRSVMDLLATEVYPHDYPDADVIIMLHRRACRIREAPVRMFPGADKSMHSGLLRPLYYTYKMGLAILMALLRRYE